MNNSTLQRELHKTQDKINLIVAVLLSEPCM